MMKDRVVMTYNEAFDASPFWIEAIRQLGFFVYDVREKDPKTGDYYNYEYLVSKEEIAHLKEA